MKKPTYLIFCFLYILCYNVRSQENEGPTCTSCHSNINEHSVKHSVVEAGCDNCHIATSNRHPKTGVKGFDLAEQQPGLCFMCHEEFSKSIVHAPAGENCTVCHDPHGSDNHYMLKAETETDLCAQCHDMGFMELKVTHGPAAIGACTTCHDPHESDFPAYLNEAKPGLCFQCHETLKKETTKAVVHYPFGEDCSGCHSAHGTDNKSLLIEKQADLCSTCHDVIPAEGYAGTVHDVISEGDGCSNCHLPHASDQPGLIPTKEKELCLECHKRSIDTEKRPLTNIGELLGTGYTVHEVVKNDGCIICHNPHKSENTLLLNTNYPAGQYASATAANFELCFMCHSSEIIEDQYSSTVTNFRNGETNLHYLHINGEKGRTCSLCHNTHGTKNVHLIGEKVWFGKWQMPMGFKITETGGSCATGCHKKLEYSR